MMHSSEARTLPPGYSLTDRSTIKAVEVIVLRAVSDLDSGLTQPEWDCALQHDLGVIAVRHRAKRSLVGIGFLAGHRTEAMLCDVVVSPRHRHKGIGSFIVQQSKYEAESLGITTLTAHLEPTNTIQSVYQGLGFTASANLLLWQRPAAE